MMRSRSSNSAGAVYLDREARIAELEAAIRQAAGKLPSLRRVVLFGSLVSGIPTPRSDADLLVELADSPHPWPRDRVPEVLWALPVLPCPVDLFVYTSAELDELREEHSPVVEAAHRHGRELFAR